MAESSTITVEANKVRTLLQQLSSKLIPPFPCQVTELAEGIKKLVALLFHKWDRVSSQLGAYLDHQRLVWATSDDTKLGEIEHGFGEILRTLQDLETKLIPGCEQLSVKCTNLLKRILWVLPLQVCQLANLQNTKEQITSLKLKLKKKALVFQRQPQRILETRELEYGPGQVLKYTRDEFDAGKLRLLPCYYSSGQWDYKKKDTFELFLVERKLTEKIEEGNFIPNVSDGSSILLHSSALSNLSGTTKNIFILPSRESHTEEPYWLCANVTLKGETFTVLSLPLWVQIPTSQMPKVWATCLWHQSFPTGLKINFKFETPNEIPWSFLSHAIRYHFSGLGRALTAEEMVFLQKTIFGEKIPGYKMVMVTKERFQDNSFADFAVEGETGRTVSTVGEWLYLCHRLLSRDDIRRHWADGKIIGFIDDEKIKEKLRGLPAKTFAIRMSPTLANSISLHYNETATEIKKKRLTETDLERISFPNRILRDTSLEHAIDILDCKSDAPCLFNKRRTFQHDTTFMTGEELREMWNLLEGRRGFPGTSTLGRVELSVAGAQAPR